MKFVELETLFSPKKIGNVEIKNRIMRSPTFVARASEDGFLTDDYINYYTEVAKGGVGLLTPGTMLIDQAGAGIAKAPCLYDDKFVEGHKRFVNSVHENSEAKIASQINHTGNNAGKPGVELVGPSAKWNPAFKKECRKLTAAEIEQIIKNFVEGGRRVYESGYDLVELHGAHGFLLSDFVSPFANTRSDDYGGTTEGRCKILVDIYNGLRDITDKNFPILIKLNVQDYLPGGLTFEEGKEIVKILIETGFDAIEISCGRTSTKFTGGKRYPALTVSSPEEENFFLPFAKELKPLMNNRPIILMGGIRNPITADEILRKNYADFVSMGRPFIHEPNLPNRWKSGDLSPAKCISCNQCFTTQRPGPVYCVVKRKAEERS